MGNHLKKINRLGRKKRAQKMLRKAATGHEYIFSEGVIPMIDSQILGF